MATNVNRACHVGMILAILSMMTAITGLFFYNRHFEEYRVPTTFNHTLDLNTTSNHPFVLLSYTPWRESWVADPWTIALGLTIMTTLWAIVYQLCGANSISYFGEKLQHDRNGWKLQNKGNKEYPKNHIVPKQMWEWQLVPTAIILIIGGVCVLSTLTADYFVPATENPDVWISEFQFGDKGVKWVRTGSCHATTISYYQGNTNVPECGDEYITFLHQDRNGTIHTDDGETWDRVCLKSEDLRAQTDQDKYMDLQTIFIGIMAGFNLFLIWSGNVFLHLIREWLLRRLRCDTPMKKKPAPKMTLRSVPVTLHTARAPNSLPPLRNTFRHPSTTSHTDRRTTGAKHPNTGNNVVPMGRMNPRELSQPPLLAVEIEMVQPERITRGTSM